MSILIKGMKLPENDGMKELVIGRAPNGTEPIAIVSGDITEFYKIIEIPASHGRLIDVDKAATSISMMNNHPCGNSIETVNDVVEWLRFVDENGNNIAFPTIIEAEAE